MRRHANLRVGAQVGPYVIHSDQPAAAGGDGSAAACSGLYVLGFCQARGLPTDGIRLPAARRDRSDDAPPAAPRLEVTLADEGPTLAHAVRSFSPVWITLRSVSFRSSVAAALALAFVSAMPVTARGQELPAAVVTEAIPVAPVIDPIGVRLRLVAQTTLPRLALFAPTPEEIRLSHGAKVAIIVSAIVVGSLVVLGLVVFSRPGHL